MDRATLVKLALATQERLSTIKVYDPGWNNADECVAFLRKAAEWIWEEEARQRNVRTTAEIEIWYDEIVIGFYLSCTDPESKQKVVLGFEWQQLTMSGR